MMQPDPRMGIRQEVSAQCARIGADPLLVQGAGGNVSWKTNDSMWIKASGTWLADAQRSDIFVPVDLAHLREAIGRADFAVSPRVQGESSLRPSIETLLHALMPQRVVMHVHAIEVLSRLVRADLQDNLRQIELPGAHWAIVPYLKPGAELAAGVHQALDGRPEVNVIFLRNHGLVIGAESALAAADLLDVVVSGCRQAVPALPSIEPPQADVLDASGHRWQPVRDTCVHELALVPQLFERLGSAWALYPDHVVFLGARAVTLDGLPALRASSDEVIGATDIVFVRGAGVFSRGPLSAGKLAQLRCYRDVLVRQDPDVPLATLSEGDIGGLLNWDAERYRMQLAK